MGGGEKSWVEEKDKDSLDGFIKRRKKNRKKQRRRHDEKKC